MVIMKSVYSSMLSCEFLTVCDLLRPTSYLPLYFTLQAVTNEKAFQPQWRYCTFSNYLPKREWWVLEITTSNWEFWKPGQLGYIGRGEGFFFFPLRGNFYKKFNCVKIPRDCGQVYQPRIFLQHSSVFCFFFNRMQRNHPKHMSPV